MTNILLIDEDTLKTNGLINDNVDGCYLQPAMVLAQEIGLQLLIGTRLLNKIKDLIRTNDIMLESNKHYKYLLDEYITNYLIWETTSELQIPISFKTANSGSVLNTDDHKLALDINDVEYLKEYYKDKARFFAKLLSDYLCKNASLYKEYPGCCNDGLIGGEQDYSGIYFPGNRHLFCHYDYDKK